MKICAACGERFADIGWTCPSCGTAPHGDATGILRFAPEIAKSGFEPEYFGLLAGLEASNFWFCARNRIIAWGLREFFPQSKTFLEVGCGTGFVLQGLQQRFPDLELAGAELFDEGLAVARRRLPDVPLYQVDARRLPFESEFDVVGVFDVLEHIPEDDAVLAQLYAAIHPGGGMMVTVPQHSWLWSAADDFARHERRYVRGDLVGKVEAAGFEVLHVTSFIVLLLPVLLATRLRRRMSGSTYDPVAELRLRPFVNGALERVVDAELALTRRRWDWAAGGSLLLIARRPPIS